MYVDHHSAKAMQHHRSEELRRLAARRRALESVDVKPTEPSRWALFLRAARLRARHV